MPQVSGGCWVPTNQELQTIERELWPRYANRTIFDILPIQSTEFARISFLQPDTYKGLQNYRGLDQPTRQIPNHYNPYGTMCSITPGYWGEHDYVSERFITEAAAPGSFCGGPVDLIPYITMLQQNLIERRYNRMEVNAWLALLNGVYYAYGEDGQVIYESTFDIRTYATDIPWSDYENSHPLADFRTITASFGLGTSASFGTDAVAYMNPITANCMFANQNTWDLGKIGLAACCDVMGPDTINRKLNGQGLPGIRIVPDSQLSEDGTPFRVIPDGKVLIVGRRPSGVPIGHYWYTRNAVTCGVTSGPWTKIVDNCDQGVPRKIKIFDGHNGGPAIEYPRAVVVLETGCTANSPAPVNP